MKSRFCITPLRTLSIVASLLAILTHSSVLAATGDIIPGTQPLTAIITGPDDIAVGRTVVLDASSSVGLGEDTTYQWFLDGFSVPISKTVEAVYTPEQAGTTTIRLVLQTTINGERTFIEATKTLIVYERKMVLIADASVPREKLQIHKQAAEDEGIYIRILQPRTVAGSPLAW